MFDSLKIKAYDLEPVYVSWPDAPVFSGSGAVDPAEWLEQIKAGCKERKVPKEYWHRVARHYMGPKPRERLDELGKVMAQMTGNKAHWDWKKFKIAVQNLGWGTPVVGPKSQKALPPISQRPLPKKQGSWWVVGKADSSSSDKENELIVAKARSTTPPPTPPHDYRGELIPLPMPSPQIVSPDAGQLTTISKAPAWLVNACQAMDFLTQEHPRAMSAMSAILLTIGAIPAIPAISAGAGGAILASGAVQAAGAVAMGVGQALKAMQNGQVKVDAPAVHA